MFGNSSLKGRPIMKGCGCDSPHIILKLSLADRRSWISFINSVFLSYFTAGLQSTII